MRFMTWSAITSIFVTSTVALLLSLIPVANATVNVNITIPIAGGKYTNGWTTAIAWSVNTDEDLSNVVCDLYMVDNLSNIFKIVATGVPLLNNNTLASFPSDALPSNEWFVKMITSDKTSIGLPGLEFHSNMFSISSPYSNPSAPVEVTITSPLGGDEYHAGETGIISWSFSNPDPKHYDLSNVFGVIYVKDGRGDSFTLGVRVPLQNGSLTHSSLGPIRYPGASAPGNDFFIKFETTVGNFTSGHFTINAA